MADVEWRMSAKERDLVAAIRNVDQRYKEVEKTVKRTGVASEDAGKKAKKGATEARKEVGSLDSSFKGVTGSVVRMSAKFLSFGAIAGGAMRGIRMELQEQGKAAEQLIANIQKAQSITLGRTGLGIPLADVVRRQISADRMPTQQVPITEADRLSLAETFTRINEDAMPEQIKSVIQQAGRIAGPFGMPELTRFVENMAALSKQQDKLGLDMEQMGNLALRFQQANVNLAAMDRTLLANLDVDTIEPLLALMMGAGKAGRQAREMEVVIRRAAELSRGEVDVERSAREGRVVTTAQFASQAEAFQAIMDRPDEFVEGRSALGVRAARALVEVEGFLARETAGDPMAEAMQSPEAQLLRRRAQQQAEIESQKLGRRDVRGRAAMAREMIMDEAEISIRAAAEAQGGLAPGVAAWMERTVVYMQSLFSSQESLVRAMETSLETGTPIQQVRAENFERDMLDVMRSIYDVLSARQVGAMVTTPPTIPRQSE